MAFKSRGVELTTSLSTPSWGTVPSGETWVLTALSFTNKDTVTTIEHAVTCQVVKHANNGGGSYYLAFNMPLAYSDRLNVVSDVDSKPILEAGDQIRFMADANSVIDAFLSFLTQVA